jgi:glycosyltransferase involved in cell wall biosynthesis
MKLRLIAVLQDVAEAGALASSCGNQLKALASQHDCALITNGALPSELPSVPIVVLPLPSLHWLGRHRQVPRQVVFWLMVGIVLGLSRRTRGVDLVIVHSHPAIAMLAPLLRRLRGFKMVLVMHGDINDRPPGTYDRLLTWWYRICTAPAYRWADAVLALSPYMADLAIRGGAKPHRVHLAPNGLDAEEIGLEQLPPPPQGQNLLFIGRMEFNKGVDLLVAAFCQLAPQYPELQLTCIGAANGPYLQPLQRQLQAMGLSGRVHLLPPQPRIQLGPFYRDAALVVIPSRSETQSTVAMEAMAAGRAVLASDMGGNPMLVDSPTTGLLFRTGDAADFACQLERLIRSPATLAAMGRAAAVRHQTLFTRQRRAAVLRDCIDRLAACLPPQEPSMSLR